MRAMGTWSLALAAALGLAVTALADDAEPKPAPSGNWFTRLFVKDKKAPEAKKTQGPELPPALVRERARHELLRRQELCFKLRDIALQTGDEELRRKADLLDQRAWDVYVQQTGQPSGTLTPDEQILENRLGPNARSGEPAVTGAASGTAARNLVEGRAAARGN